jgi:hypothetical protein
MARFEIKSRWSGEVLFACELSAEVAGKEYEVQLGFAVRKAVEARANLARANLTDANLADANLAGANLTDANLAGANLARANLTDANLAGANLTDANLAGANLARANLTDANLADANLTDANLADANLAGANLAGANLADAKDADLVIAQTRILPEGDLIGWKKCGGGVIVKLRIPAEAKRSHAFGRKCRAEYAEVLEVIGAEVGVTNNHGPRTEYRAGETVRPDSFDDNWQDECSHGIHFFITRAEAEAYW